MTDREALEMLLKTYVEMNQINSSPGEKSHALWHSTEFIKRQINDILKRLKNREDFKTTVKEIITENKK